MHLIKKFLPALAALCVMFAPMSAHAAWGIVDSFNLAPFVPMVLDAFMTLQPAAMNFLSAAATVLYTCWYGCSWEYQWRYTW